MVLPGITISWFITVDNGYDIIGTSLSLYDEWLLTHGY